MSSHRLAAIYLVYFISHYGSTIKLMG